MRDIYLHGYLGEKYGKHFSFAAETPVQAIRLLAANFPEFRFDLNQGYYRVIRGDLDSGLDLEPHTLGIRLGKKALHIVPVPEGAKQSSGIGKAIIGAMIVITAVVLAPATGGTSLAGAAAGLAPGAGAAAAAAGALTGLSATAVLGLTYGNIALFGAVLALSGITQLVSPQQSVSSYGDRETPEERPSFVFNGAVNTSEQGGIRQLVYGRMLVGSTVISGGLQVEQI